MRWQSLSDDAYPVLCLIICEDDDEVNSTGGEHCRLRKNAVVECKLEREGISDTKGN